MSSAIKQLPNEYILSLVQANTALNSLEFFLIVFDVFSIFCVFLIVCLFDAVKVIQ
jgi:hypothetical protein